MKASPAQRHPLLSPRAGGGRGGHRQARKQAANGVLPSAARSLGEEEEADDQHSHIDRDCDQEGLSRDRHGASVRALLAGSRLGGGPGWGGARDTAAEGASGGGARRRSVSRAVVPGAGSGACGRAWGRCHAAPAEGRGQPLRRAGFLAGGSKHKGVMGPRWLRQPPPPPHRGDWLAYPLFHQTCCRGERAPVQRCCRRLAGAPHAQAPGGPPEAQIAARSA